PVADFMVTNLITVTTEDPSLVATAIMHEHGFKWLPVVDSHENRCLQGYVRAERMLNLIVAHMRAL
ncbi:MAG: CBS domain-containing protein, partial [Candidatus Tectomicrobia bacterium]